MDNVKRIEELLNMYLKQNKDIRDKYQNNLVNLQLYEELFSYLELDYVEIKENNLFISIQYMAIIFMVIDFIVYYLRLWLVKKVE